MSHPILMGFSLAGEFIVAAATAVPSPLFAPGETLGRVLVMATDACGYAAHRPRPTAVRSVRSNGVGRRSQAVNSKDSIHFP